MARRRSTPVAVLVEHGAGVNAVDEAGRTPLLVAAVPVWDNSEAVRLLLDHGADIRARDQRGSRALLNAANGLRSSLVEPLLSRGAPANVADNAGATLLHKDALYWTKPTLRELDTLALLCASRLAPDVKDHEGKTPLAIVRER